MLMWSFYTSWAFLYLFYFAAVYRKIYVFNPKILIRQAKIFN